MSAAFWKEMVTDDSINENLIILLDLWKVKLRDASLIPRCTISDKEWYIFGNYCSAVTKHSQNWPAIYVCTDSTLNTCARINPAPPGRLRTLTIALGQLLLILSPNTADETEKIGTVSSHFLFLYQIWATFVGLSSHRGKIGSNIGKFRKFLIIRTP